MGMLFSGAAIGNLPPAPPAPPPPPPPALPPSRMPVLHYGFDGEEDLDLTFSFRDENLTIWDTDNSYFDLGGGNDTVTMSGFGMNTFDLGEGDDFFNGWDSYDDQLVWGHLGDDFILGGFGDDFFNGEDGDDVLDGDVGNDTLFGGTGDDILVGGHGKDVVSGGEGWDVLVAGIGDTLFGGNGSDTFDFGALDGEQGRLTIYADPFNDHFDFSGLDSDTRVYFAGNNMLISNPDLGTSIVVQVIPTYDDDWGFGKG